MKDKELESKLQNVFDDHKRKFKVSNGNSLERFRNNTHEAQRLLPKLLVDLIDTANRHFEEYDIDDTSEAKDLIGKLYGEFSTFCLLHA